MILVNGSNVSIVKGKASDAMAGKATAATVTIPAATHAAMLDAIAAAASRDCTFCDYAHCGACYSCKARAALAAARK